MQTKIITYKCRSFDMCICEVATTNRLGVVGTVWYQLTEVSWSTYPGNIPQTSPPKQKLLKGPAGHLPGVCFW